MCSGRCAREYVWSGGNENALSSATRDSFKSFKLRLFSNNELASFAIVFDPVVVFFSFFYEHKRFRLFHFLEQNKNGIGANTGNPCESELLSLFIQPLCLLFFRFLLPFCFLPLLIFLP